MNPHETHETMRRQVWLNAWSATASANDCKKGSVATVFADKALKDFDERFPKPAEAVPDSIVRGLKDFDIITVVKELKDAGLVGIFDQMSFTAKLESILAKRGLRINHVEEDTKEYDLKR